MQWRLATSSLGKRVEAAARAALMVEHSVEMFAVSLRLDHWQQRIDGVRDGSDECDIN